MGCGTYDEQIRDPWLQSELLCFLFAVLIVPDKLNIAIRVIYYRGYLVHEHFLCFSLSMDVSVESSVQKRKKAHHRKERGGNPD